MVSHSKLAATVSIAVVCAVTVVAAWKPPLSWTQKLPDADHASCSNLAPTNVDNALVWDGTSCQDQLVICVIPFNDKSCLSDCGVASANSLTMQGNELVSGSECAYSMDADHLVSSVWIKVVVKRLDEKIDTYFGLAKVSFQGSYIAVAEFERINPSELEKVRPKFTVPITMECLLGTHRPRDPMICQSWVGTEEASLTWDLVFDSITLVDDHYNVGLLTAGEGITAVGNATSFQQEKAADGVVRIDFYIPNQEQFQIRPGDDTSRNVQVLGVVRLIPKQGTNVSGNNEGTEDASATGENGHKTRRNLNTTPELTVVRRVESSITVELDADASPSPAEDESHDEDAPSVKAPSVAKAPSPAEDESQSHEEDAPMVKVPSAAKAPSPAKERVQAVVPSPDKNSSLNEDVSGASAAAVVAAGAVIATVITALLVL